MLGAGVEGAGTVGAGVYTGVLGALGAAGGLGGAGLRRFTLIRRVRPSFGRVHFTNFTFAFTTCLPYLRPRLVFRELARIL